MLLLLFIINIIIITTYIIGAFTCITNTHTYTLYGILVVAFRRYAIAIAICFT